MGWRCQGVWVTGAHDFPGPNGERGRDEGTLNTKQVQGLRKWTALYTSGGAAVHRHGCPPWSEHWISFLTSALFSGGLVSAQISESPSAVLGKVMLHLREGSSLVPDVRAGVRPSLGYFWKRVSWFYLISQPLETLNPASW